LWYRRTGAHRQHRREECDCEDAAKTSTKTEAMDNGLGASHGHSDQEGYPFYSVEVEETGMNSSRSPLSGGLKPLSIGGRLGIVDLRTARL
jgi:hypothetical protein